MGYMYDIKSKKILINLLLYCLNFSLFHLILIIYKHNKKSNNPILHFDYIYISILEQSDIVALCSRLI